DAAARSLSPRALLRAPRPPPSWWPPRACRPPARGVGVSGAGPHRGGSGRADRVALGARSLPRHDRVVRRDAPDPRTGGRVKRGAAVGELASNDGGEPLVPDAARFRRPLTDRRADLIAERLRVLGHPLRVKLIEHLLGGQTSVQELVESLETTTQQNVSQ